MDSKGAFEAVKTAAIEEIGNPPLLMPEYGSRQVSISSVGPCRFEVRFIASSPLDFARRVQATVEQDRSSSEWQVVTLEISGRIDPFSTP